MKTDTRIAAPLGSGLEPVDANNAGAPASQTMAKFSDPRITADGSARAQVGFDHLETLWINTGTLCNLSCTHCYIESTPTNDALVYVTRHEARPFLGEARAMGAREIGFTGGEPFLNPEFPAILGDALELGFSVLVLTNAMRPMMRPGPSAALLDLRARHGDRLGLRVSLDHYTDEHHDIERGSGTFATALEGIDWLVGNGFSISVAGRSLIGEDEATCRAGFAMLFQARGIPLDAKNPGDLVIFPEMDADADTPEITNACWGILGKSPSDVMCSTSRMVVKRKGAKAPTVLACTLIAYKDEFDLGPDIATATAHPVSLNHPHCSRFCVLGGASCSGG